MSRVSGVVEQVRLMILRGEAPAGGWLIEVHLANAFDVPRTTVREALRVLEGQGLLRANDDGGMRVVTLDRAELVATLQVRAALEALGAGLVAERHAAGELPGRHLAELARLADVADAAARGGDPTAAVVADRNLHRALDALAENGPSHDALNRAWDRIVVGALQSPAVSPPGPADRDHRELLAALAEGDADEASAVARRHVLGAIT